MVEFQSVVNPESTEKRLRRISFFGALTDRIVSDALVEWKHIVMNGFGQISPATHRLSLLLRENNDLSEKDRDLLDEIEATSKRAP